MSANNAPQPKHQQRQQTVACRSRSLSPSASVASSTIDEVCGGLADRRDDEDMSSLGETLELNAPPPLDTDVDRDFLHRVAQLNRQISAQLLDAVTSAPTPQSVQGIDGGAAVNGTLVQRHEPKLRRRKVKKRSARRLTLELLTSDDEANEFAEQRSSPYLEPQTRRSRQEERPHLKSSFETLYGGGGEEFDDLLIASVGDVSTVGQLESGSKSRACQTDTGDACLAGAENRAIANGTGGTTEAAAIGPPAVGAVAAEENSDKLTGPSRVDVGSEDTGGQGLSLQSARVLVAQLEQPQQQKQQQQPKVLSVSEQLKQLFSKQTEQPKRLAAPVVTRQSTLTAVTSVTEAAVDSSMAAGSAAVKQPDQQHQQQQKTFKLNPRRCLQLQQEQQWAANHVSRVNFSVASASPPLSAPVIPPRRAHQHLQRRCKSIQALAPAPVLSNGYDAAYPHLTHRDQPPSQSTRHQVSKTLRFRSGSFGDVNCYYPAPRPQSSCLEIGVLLQGRPRWRQNRRHDAELIVTRLRRIDRADPVSELELMCRRMRLDDADLMEGAELRDRQEQRVAQSRQLPVPQLRRKRNRTPDRLLDDQARRRIAWCEQQQQHQQHQQPLNFIGRASDGAKAQQQGRNGIAKATPQPSAMPLSCLSRTNRYVNNASTSNRHSINSNQSNYRTPAAAAVSHQSTCFILSNLAEDDADTEDPTAAPATAADTSTVRHRVRRTRWRWLSKAAGETACDAESNSDGSTSVASSTTDANGALDFASTIAASDDTDDDDDASDYDNHDEARNAEKLDRLTSSLGLRKAASLNDVDAWWGHAAVQQQLQQHQLLQHQQKQQNQPQQQQQQQRFWKTLEVRYGSEGELSQLAAANSNDAISVARRRSCTSSYFVHIRSPLSHQPLLEEETN